MLSSLMVTFPATAEAGALQDIEVTGIQDTESEGTEVLSVNILAATGISVNGNGNDFTAFVNINVLDDDSKPVIRIRESCHCVYYTL